MKFTHSLLQQELKNPLWWKNLRPLWDELNQELSVLPKEEARRQKYAVYQIFQDIYQEGGVYIETEGKDLDVQRKPIDTVVIHHTGSPSGISLERINIVHLLRLYAGWGYAIKDEERKIWSGHFMHGKQVFYAYHWLVREDGTITQLLDDSMIGWQAGKWEVNTRSVAICFDDELHGKEPSEKALEAARNLIKERYGSCTVIGHCEVNTKTDCPGDLFHSWRSKLA